MPAEDFIGRWVSGNNWPPAVTIEIDIVDDRLVVRAIDESDGELAKIHDVTQGDEEVRFAAHWSSGQTTTYRLLRSDDRLTVHVTVSDIASFKRDLNPSGTPNWYSGVLHVAPGDSAGGALRQAVRASGRSDHVLRFLDDLSCGPVESDETSARLLWWASLLDERPDRLTGFGIASLRPPTA